MSERSDANKPGLPRELRLVLGDRAIASAFLIFSAPLALIVFVEWVDGRQTYFPWNLFAWATGLEFFALAIVRVAALFRRITRRSERLASYLIRMVMGLPFTVYLLLFFPFPEPGFVRFLGGVMAIRQHRQRAASIYHLILFSSGFLVFAFLRELNWPRVTDIIRLCTAIGGGAVILALLNHMDRIRMDIRRRHHHPVGRSTRLAVVAAPGWPSILRDRLHLLGWEVRVRRGQLSATLHLSEIGSESVDALQMIGRLHALVSDLGHGLALSCSHQPGSIEGGLLICGEDLAPLAARFYERLENRPGGVVGRQIRPEWATDASGHRLARDFEDRVKRLIGND